MDDQQAQNDFSFVPNVSLESALEPDPAVRLLQKDVDRRENFSREIAAGAQKKGYASVVYQANASAGVEVETVDLNLRTVPLTLIWYLGSVDKEGVTVDTEAMIVAGRTNAISASGFLSNVGAYWNKTTLTFTVTSVNVGWAPLIEAKFYYATFYDEPDLRGSFGDGTL